MKFYIISLKRNHDRFEKLSKQLLESVKGLSVDDVILVDAIDGASHLSEHGYNNSSNTESSWMTPKSHLALTAGEYGCTLSHFKAWKMAFLATERSEDGKGGYNNISDEGHVFLEDDVEILNFDKMSPDSIGSFLLLSSPSRQPTLMYLGRKKMDMRIREREIVPGILAEASFSYWACAYALNNKAIKALTDQSIENIITKEAVIPVDEILPFISGALNHEKYINFTSQQRHQLPSIYATTFVKPIVRPRKNAFQTSSTFFSPSVFKFIKDKENVLIVTVASPSTHDGLAVLRETTASYGMQTIVISPKEWLGGNMQQGPGGAHKIIALNEFLNDSSSPQDILDPSTIIAFVDGFDVFANDSAKILSEKFTTLEKEDENKGGGIIVFSTEETCWPDKTLESKYPSNETTNNIKNRFLNSGVIIGRVSDMKVLAGEAMSKCSKADDDDQGIFTRMYLSQQPSPSFKIILDTSRTFSICVADEVSLPQPSINTTFNYITYESSRPVFIHGNGSYRNKMIGASLSNYCAGGRIGCWNSTYGSGISKTTSLNIFPDVIIIYDAENLQSSSPFSSLVDELKTIIVSFTSGENGGNFFPREKIISSLIIRGNYSGDVDDNASDGATIKLLHTKSSSSLARISLVCDHLSRLQMVNNSSTKILYLTRRVEPSPNMLTELSIATAKSFSIVAPVLRGQGLFSNFWGKVDHNGFYERSHDYVDILDRTRHGLFIVPYAWDAIFTDVALFSDIELFAKGFKEAEGIDMSWCRNVYSISKYGKYVRILAPGGENDVCGTLKSEVVIPPPPPHPLYNMIIPQSNLATIGKPGTPERKQWMLNYIDPTFASSFKFGSEPAPNVHLTTMFTPKFCEEVIAAANSQSTKWSDGGDGNVAFDARINNVENHPTNDIHLGDIVLDSSVNRITLRDVWATVISEIVVKAVINEYNYYKSDINIAFVSKYTVDGQKALRNHHDASVWTLNVCLNGDFEGGGSCFKRIGYTANVKNPGDALVHPGRLTHEHSGVAVTKGTRYILVTFVG